jgi:hypothetical protein
MQAQPGAVSHVQNMVIENMTVKNESFSHLTHPYKLSFLRL